MPPHHSISQLESVPPLTVRKRAVSVELGDGDFAINYNRHGRPIRKSAGKKSPDPDYVDIGALDEQLSEFVDGIFSEEEEEVEDVDEDDEPLRKKMKKRKRTPSPTPPPLSPLPPEDVPSRESTPDTFELDVPVERLDLEPINLTFNIQPGFSGPLNVQLDLSNVPLRAKRARLSESRKKCEKDAKVVSKAMDREKKGFLSLPPELRNKVYRHLFKDKERFDFNQPTNFKRSAAFLRSCKQVYEEGRTILYGENSFYFQRNKDMRRPFWAGERKEIGYKDLRLFLHLIGKSNTSYIRHLWLCFDDAMPSATPHLKRCEERRYVHDPHLIECLKVLAKQARLKKISMTFWGRRALATTDARFLEHLSKIKADTIEMRSPWTDNYPWHTPNRIHEDARTMLKKDMTRKNKLYTEE